MCTQEAMAKAIEQYIEDESALFGELNTGYQTWYKESVENNTSTQHQPNVEPTIMSNARSNSNTNTNSETSQENTMNDQQQQAAPGAMEKTKGFFSNLWTNHGKKIMFVAGIVTGAGAAVGYDTYANRETSTGGSEQA